MPRHKSAALRRRVYEVLEEGPIGGLIDDPGLRGRILREYAGAAGEEQGDHDKSLHATLRRGVHF